MRIYNTLTRKKEKFVPINEDMVTMYYCGITPYDKAHLGNARASVVGDLIFRVLRNEYGADHVKYARNITDIDDKIELKSKETGRTISNITSETIEWYHDNLNDLNVLLPSLEPRVSDNEEPMMDMITTLVEKKHAYITDSGDIYFDLSSFPEHGKLSRHNREDLIIGEEQSSQKRHPQDFVLWKENHQRFGWHIECSAMIKKHLGITIDIHGGGGDLRFPHHDNEIAQSEATNDAPLANYWMHNGMITVDGKKMAKSTGNFITVDEALEYYPGEAIRFYMLRTHYRKPLDWTWEGLEAAKGELDGLYRKMEGIGQISYAHKDVIKLLEDDLNTSGAITKLHESVPGMLRASGALMGILESDNWFIDTDVDIEWIEQQIQTRDSARLAKDYAMSDTIRATLLEKGIVLEDSGDTTIWRKK